MHISVGSDHRGYKVKAKILELLEQLGHSTSDAGANGDDSVDYPDIANTVSQNVSDGSSDRGILICGTGIGMAIAANKYKGVRAATCHDTVTAEMSRRHNNLNVLCLSADLFGERSVEQLVSIWLETEFEGGRHERRINKISDTEAR
ncbi:MAG: ribose 5-phosphate isomerase B [Planctomycetota bacterium]|nr:ribose 5-phosphate isomerase B [Planctomycetota bacterium]